MAPSENERTWRHHTAQRGDHGWRTRGVWVYGPRTEAHAEWAILTGRGHGIGFDLGRNGMESDVGLDLFAGRLGSLWLRLRCPWTKFLRISKDSGDPLWYESRHYGLRFAPFRGCAASVRFGSYDGMGPEARRWRDITLTKRTVFGLSRLTTTEGESGMTKVPTPEGEYPAAWVEVISESRYLGPLGKVRDRIMGPNRHRYIKLEVPGGIPVEGKGENSWDCGMDGIFGTSGKTVAEAVGNCARSVLRYRERYGGPHNLPRPMSVTEAEAWS